MVYPIGMYVKYRDLEQMALDLFYALEQIPDSKERMTHAADLLILIRQRLTDIRNEAAYAARDGVTTTRLQESTGKDRSSIESWSRTWADKKGLPLRRNRINRPWDVGFRNLTGE